VAINGCISDTVRRKAFVFSADGAAVRDSAPPRPFKMGRLDLGGTVGRSVDEQTEEKRTKLEQFAPVCSQVTVARTTARSIDRSTATECCVRPSSEGRRNAVQCHCDNECANHNALLTSGSLPAAALSVGAQHGHTVALLRMQSKAVVNRWLALAVTLRCAALHCTALPLLSTSAVDRLSPESFGSVGSAAVD
jgi:hypothetical protein